MSTFASASAGDQVKFDQVLAVRDDNGLRLGQPMLPAASVTAEVISVSQGPQTGRPEVSPSQKLSPQDGPPAALYPRQNQQDRRWIAAGRCHPEQSDTSP